jgi:hypothetical protein
MKYLLYKDGAGFAKYNPDDGSISHTLDYLNADEACLSDWSDVLAFDFGDYHQILCAGSVEKLQRAAAQPNSVREPSRTHDTQQPET